jgi:hypothetical protein
MADLNPIENIHALFNGMNFIAIEIRRALFELGEVFHRPQAALGTMNLLIKEATQADGIEAQTPLPGSHIRIHMELARGVAVDMAVQARNT